MFINPDSGQQAVEMLNVLVAALTEKSKLSQLDSKILDSVVEIRDTLIPKPYPGYTGINEAVRVYVQLRDQLSVERKAWETHESEVKSYQDKISMFLRDKGDELGVDSFNTQYGTAYRNTKTSYRIESWDEFKDWMMKTGNLQCVEKRAAKLAVKEIYELEGQLPAGLNEFVEVEFNVRRASK
jgi:hypothetical protein